MTAAVSPITLLFWWSMRKVQVLGVRMGSRVRIAVMPVSMEL